MTEDTHEYILRNGIFSQPRKLVISADRIEYQNKGGAASTIITRETFEDVRYLVEGIRWEMWTVGTQYAIDIKYDNGKILPIRFCQYLWKPRNFEKTYSQISVDIGKHFLMSELNQILDVFYADGFLEMPGLKITADKVIFESPDHEIAWGDLGLKEYYCYFAIFDKKNPSVHKRVTFYEWNAEVLYNTLKTILQDKLQLN
jgi:hypothetical protein